MRIYIEITLSVIILLTIPNFAFSVNAPFTDRMEIGTNGWTESGDLEWDLGTPSGAGEPDLPLPSPSNCWGTKLNGKYTNNRTSSLISPVIDLGSTPPKPFLSIYVWYEIAAGDYATTEVGTGVSWNRLETIGQGSSGGWVRRTYNLTGYTGNIQVRFTLSANNAQNAKGMYVDNVIIGTNMDADKYVRVLPPESTPISTPSVTNNMSVKIQIQDMLGYKDAIPGATVSLSFSEGNPNSSASATSANPADASSGEATITIKDTERESVTILPDSSLSSIPSSNKISATGRFLSPFIKTWEEKE